MVPSLLPLRSLTAVPSTLSEPIKRVVSLVSTAVDCMATLLECVADRTRLGPKRSAAPPGSPGRRDASPAPAGPPRTARRMPLPAPRDKRRAIGYKAVLPEHGMDGDEATDGEQEPERTSEVKGKRGSE